MTFQGNGPLDTSNVGAGGGGGMGRGMVIGGGSIGTVVIGLLIYFLTGSTGGVPQQASPQGGSGGSVSQADQQLEQHLKSCTVELANTDTACRIVATTNSLNKVWPTVLKGYRAPRGKTLIMPVGAQSINTGCGVADAGTGPFYCPADEVSVFQLDFMDRVIKKLGGSSGPFSQEYIVAHEYGHHVQKLIGTINKSREGNGAQGGSVRVELQADCFAGVWAAHADKGADAMLAPLTQQQISDAITTAKAIGDDTIQRNAGRNPNPESFSHGTSAQRVKWFTQGYQTGDPNQCNTFSGTI
ncbi:KPN_02809 family neutral zinc metallopeptidase [Tsukamurella ocularis]|uniref:KPN_02809 family neutral zinc metallopeptidase n=1 Tax=Tsukamurella ocularis TaxID=1970234 RepID=UPI0021692C24|nr:neutral zinc metallopeptidase [Tsukamurella ocularis]MCS3779952.1 putative metalloprotease [Tsukamurella ocularis]MCS3788648.1 putative metalloprotease [Tsukamurella ocularis]MCS3849858.1 putative metalloprotease [Tsukamurella ocularis]